MAPKATESDVADINTISRFLAHVQVPDLTSSDAVDVVVLCGSAILHTAETVFRALQQRPSLCKTLVICGGVGHSTSHLYDAVHTHPRFKCIDGEITGRPEAVVLDHILRQFYDVDAMASQGLTVLVEDKSTNCGANAIETRRVLEVNGISTPKSIVVVQDPTMSLRTLAAFRHVYGDVVPAPSFSTCPTFVPEMAWRDGEVTWNVQGVQASGLWETQRFFDLVLGEVPRIRDDEMGYGPRGKGFIAHVDVPDEVEAAWKRLRGVLTSHR